MAGGYGRSMICFAKLFALMVKYKELSYATDDVIGLLSKRCRGCGRARLVLGGRD